MTKHTGIGHQVQKHFEEKWEKGDPWNLDSSLFEHDKYECQFRMISDRRYARVLEIGCGNGYFSRRLSLLAERVVALDIAPSAIERARAAGTADGVIDFRVANAMEYDPTAEGPWDLIVFSETLPFLGWLYPMFDVGWLARQLFEATHLEGRLLMCNTLGENVGHLLRPWMVHTYHDLFRNVGYQMEMEEVFRGVKDDVNIESRISVYSR
jgi:SAM-dependent methyltransferase